ncbi:MAG TPA: thioredoxin domain-containing protein [Rhizomicrobium sp.]|nr:thioredoxin domain-containing protein [Rhizomicrobium sp.]
MPATALQNTASPYLRLHRDNPVQWQAWGPDTLAQAQAENKPIFLSLGYTSCHWCLVMNEESFSDAGIAALINQNFIPILVDREERPDLDIFYQSAQPAMGLRGGWPLNVFLTPEGAPYFAVNYLPPEERLGQPSFRTAVSEAISLWKDRNAQAREQAANVRAQLENVYERDMRTPPDTIQLDLVALGVARNYDIFFGGQHGTQKFTNPQQLELLWRAYLRSGVSQFSQMLFTTLDHVLFGGIYDHIGGGFFRYAEDERWTTPYFEKTLADSAQMVDLLTGIWQHNRSELARSRIEETIGWMLREMKLPGGGFATTLHSQSEGEHGKYYLWSETEIDAALVGTFSAKFKSVYAVTSDGTIAGRNLPRRIGAGAQETSDADEILMTKQRGLLLETRSRRTPPTRDDKILADWNGLAIAALARAGMALDRGEWVAEAVIAFTSVVARLGDGATLYHSAVGDERGAEGFADDYANMALAAMQLYEVSGDKRFLQNAKAWTDTLNAHFWDENRGGYFFTSDHADPMLLRPRYFADNPTPPANGTMLTVLSRLILTTGNTGYADKARHLVAAFGAEVPRGFLGMCGYINGAETYSSALQIVIFGQRGAPQTQDLIRAAWGKALPGRLVLLVEPGTALPEGHPAATGGMQNGVPTAYICQGAACSPPFTSAVQLSQVLTLPRQKDPLTST